MKQRDINKRIDTAVDQYLLAEAIRKSRKTPGVEVVGDSREERIEFMKQLFKDQE